MAKASTNVVAITGSAVAGGLATKILLSPEQGAEIAKWLSVELGPVGFVIFLTFGIGLGISVMGNWLMWNRLKEKDTECKTEMATVRAENLLVIQSWRAERAVRENELRLDNKEAFASVAVLTKQMTLLVAQNNPTNTPVRGT